MLLTSTAWVARSSRPSSCEQTQTASIADAHGAIRQRQGAPSAAPDGRPSSMNRARPPPLSQRRVRLLHARSGISHGVLSLAYRPDSAPLTPSWSRGPGSTGRDGDAESVPPLPLDSNRVPRGTTQGPRSAESPVHRSSLADGCSTWNTRSGSPKRPPFPGFPQRPCGKAADKWQDHAQMMPPATLDRHLRAKCCENAPSRRSE